MIKESEFTGWGGLRIHWRAWVPEGDVRATLLVAHGYGEHSGRYEHLGERYCARGFAVVAPDHRGHGRSEGPRGHVDRFDEYVADLHAVRIRIAEDDRPTFVIGHSMGGLIAIHYALEHGAGLAGLCLSSPALGIVAEPPALLRIIARLLAAVMPRASFQGTVDPAMLSHDLSVGLAYAADPLVHKRASARFYVELKRAMAEAHARAREIDLPTLVLQAGDDRLTDPAATAAFVAALREEIARSVVYPGFFHEIFNEVEKDRVFAELDAWLEQRLASGG